MKRFKKSPSRTGSKPLDLGMSKAILAPEAEDIDGRWSECLFGDVVSGDGGGFAWYVAADDRRGCSSPQMITRANTYHLIASTSPTRQWLGIIMSNYHARASHGHTGLDISACITYLRNAHARISAAGPWTRYDTRAGSLFAAVSLVISRHVLVAFFFCLLWIAPATEIWSVAVLVASSCRSRVCAHLALCLSHAS